MPINKPNNGASQLLILLQIDFVTIICLTAPETSSCGELFCHGGDGREAVKIYSL